MRYIGATCLLLGIMVVILSYPSEGQGLPAWTSSIGGFLIGLSYLLSWRE